MSAIVIGGARSTLGMPAFHDMPPSDLDALRAFVLDAAWKAYHPDSPREPNVSPGTP
jgi:hypothetical protein